MQMFDQKGFNGAPGMTRTCDLLVRSSGGWLYAGVHPVGFCLTCTSSVILLRPDCPRISGLVAVTVAVSDIRHRRGRFNSQRSSGMDGRSRSAIKCVSVWHRPPAGAGVHGQ